MGTQQHALGHSVPRVSWLGGRWGWGRRSSWYETNKHTSTAGEKSADYDKRFAIENLLQFSLRSAAGDGGAAE